MLHDDDLFAVERMVIMLAGIVVVAVAVAVAVVAVVNTVDVNNAPAYIADVVADANILVLMMPLTTTLVQQPHIVDVDVDRLLFLH